MLRLAGRVADVKRGANSFEEKAEAIGTLVMKFSSQRIVLSSPKLRPLYRRQVPMVTAASPEAELQPSAANSHRWQVVVAVPRGDREMALREAQLEPDEGYRRFELALAQYIRGDHQAADAALADLIANGRDQLGLPDCRGSRRAWRGRTKLSSGCKSHLIPTTPARWPFWFIRCCATSGALLATKACWQGLGLPATS